MNRTLNDLQRNQNTQDRRSDQFYVRFFRFPEDVNNFLSKQVKRCIRPNISFQYSPQRYRNNVVQRGGQLDMQPISLTFSDDEEGLINMYLDAQVMRQRGMNVDFRNLTVDDSLVEFDDTFDVEILLYDSAKRVVGGYRLLRCKIADINWSDLSLDDDSPSEVTLSLSYDNIEMRVFDKYIDLKNGAMT